MTHARPPHLPRTQRRGLGVALGLAVGVFGGGESPAQVALTHTVLVKNLNQAPVGDAPAAVHRLGNTVVVAAFTPGSGLEWWSVDPNRRRGAERIRDIAPGTRSALDRNRMDTVEVAGFLYFAADDGVHGREVWRTDGTATGTVLVKDLAEGAAGSEPGHFLEWNGRILGNGLADGSTAVGVWTSDGTREGTTWLRRWESGNLSRLVVSGGSVWFIAGGGAEPGLWKTDGTEAGTVRTATLAGDAIQPWSLSAASGRLYFFGYPPPGSDGGSLWVSDGTPSGTLRLRARTPGATGDPQTFFEAGGRSFFEAGSPGRRLWRTDGTPAGTEAVGPSALGEVFRAGDTRYVTGSAANRTELWRLDGTQGEPIRIQNFTNVSGQFRPPSGFLNLGRTVLFQGTEPEGGTELWTSDGTEAGTRRLSDLLPGSDSSFPRPFGIAGGRALIATREADGGAGLWRSDGTEPGTVRVQVLRAGRPDAFSWVAPLSGGDGEDGGPFYLVVGTERVADTTPTAPTREPFELWVTDGTPDGTRSLGSFEALPGSGLLPLARIGKVALFTTPKEHGSYEIWRTDGTRDGTYVVRNAFPERDAGSGPAQLVEQRGRVVFSARDENYLEQLWSTDGTAAGTILVRQWSLEEETAWNTPRLVAVGDTLFFARSTSQGAALWRSDGTRAGTVPLTSGRPPIDELAAAGGTLFFREGENALGTSDGSPAGTRIVHSFDSIRPGSNSNSGNGLIAVADRVYFLATTDDAGSELWVSDGTEAGTRRVRDLTPGPEGSELSGLTAVGDRLFFGLYESGQSWSLWVTDGNDAGTRRLRSFSPGVALNWKWVGAHGRLLFTAFDPEAGDEPWTSDGTEAGTVRLKDLAPGIDGSYVRRMTPAGPWTYFWSSTAEGHDLWRTDGTEAGTRRVKANTPWLSPYDEVTAVADGVLYFPSPDGLWRSDGTEAGTGPVPNPPGITPRPPFPGSWGQQQALLAVGKAVYFAADDGTTGLELWRYGETDGDRNGLPDAWEAQFFGGRAEPADDPDRDGMSNEAELYAGTDPTRTDSRLKVGMRRDEESGVVRLEWASAPGREYVVLRSEGAGQVEQVLERRIGATPPLNEFRAGVTDAPGPVVYRVKVED